MKEGWEKLDNTEKRKHIKTNTLKISILGSEKAIGVGKTVIKELGTPQYVSLYISEDGHSLMICSCEEKEPMSFKVPNGFLTAKRKNFRLHSMSFVNDLAVMNNLDAEKSYYIRGKMLESGKAAVFDLQSCVLIPEKNKSTSEDGSAS